MSNKKAVRKDGTEKVNGSLTTRFSKKDFKRFLRDALLLSLLNTVILLALLYYGENNIIKIKRQETENKIKAVLSIEENLLGSEFDYILSDIGFLEETYKNKLDTLPNLADTSKAWISFARERRAYDQIRFINMQGNEVIRVNMGADGAYQVPNSLLQNKADRYYFQETIKLNPGQIFVSKMDLNVENGIIEIPYEPVIRICTPVYNSKGVQLGIIVLNYKAEILLSRFKSIENLGSSKQYMVNSDGYWLSSPESSQEWGFMFEDKKDISFKNTYPEEWEQIIEAERMDRNDCFVYSKNGLFAHTHIKLDETIISTRTLSEENRLVMESGGWIIIAHEPAVGEKKITINGNMWSISLYVLKKFFSIFVIFIIASFIFTYFRRMLQRDRQRIEFFSMYDPLTEVYNRRAGLEKLEEISNSVERRKKRFAIVFLDVNGLKQVNDTFGHEKGDELILSVTKGLKHSIREDDFVVRMGGDEFLLVLYDTDAKDAEAAWGRITETYEKINQSEDRPYRISVSHGVVVVKDNKGLDIEELIKQADAAMYDEKKQMKKRVTIIK